MKICEVAGVQMPELPPQVAKAFDELGELQRGEPEFLMAKAQQALGGGLLSYALEHVGDITHRMTRQGGLMYWGLDAAAEKIEKMFRLLNQAYGFGKEVTEQMRVAATSSGNDARYYRVVETSLRNYAAAHQKLPVYNRAQFLAKSAAVSLGTKDFITSRSCLETLNGWTRDWDRWVAVANEYKLDSAGNVVRYRPGVG